MADYSTWPELAQVFKLESQRTDALGTTKTEVRYGVTSLPACLADPKRLLGLTRGHWGIENGLHYRPDATMREDHAQLRMGHAPEMLAEYLGTQTGIQVTEEMVHVYLHAHGYVCKRPTWTLRRKAGEKADYVGNACG
ncbi:MAG: hypothetical protein AUH89_01830 [Ktedonobacter sp. 13_1_40CM_4_52_4]|nr:MAG: hypothetical protein AUH89_01830 [Ktedonobacter sp. 13_1_40CM_4_52_4]